MTSPFTRADLLMFWLLVANLRPQRHVPSKERHFHRNRRVERRFIMEMHSAS